MWAFSPDDPANLRCLFTQADAGAFSWGPRGDRVARTCLRRAPCPVVVVPAPALARAGRGRAVRRQLCREAEQFVQAHADVLS